jgi:hypothetical protein
MNDRVTLKEFGDLQKLFKTEISPDTPDSEIPCARFVWDEMANEFILNGYDNVTKN